ncbi:hypothetical protein ACFQ60_18075 [Streptomyces zhihengii]
MPSIDELLPLGPGKDLPALRALDPELLARYVADRGNPWWRRRHCVHALEGRVPQACVPELIARVKDTGDTGEVRIALLDVLGDRPELLPWVRHEDRRDEKASGMPAALLRTRGRLGDLSAVPGLAAMAADPWARNREAGEAGLDALAARHGPAAVLALLDEKRPQDRMVRVRTRARAGEDVTGALADPDRAVAHLAASLADDADRLRSCAADPDSPSRRRCGPRTPSTASPRTPPPPGRSGHGSGARASRSTGWTRRRAPRSSTRTRPTAGG